MWLTFYITALCMLALIELPGYIALRAFGFSRPWALCAAPLAGFALIALTAQVFALVGIRANTVNVCATAIAIPVVAFLISKKCNVPALDLPTLSPLSLVLTLALGAGLGYTLLIQRMGKPDAIYQSYDVLQHFNLIRAMLDSGRLTSLGVSPYLTAADAAIAPANYSGFYPAAWHSLCTLAIMYTGASVPVAINASIVLFTCFIFPVAMDLVIAVLFPNNNQLHIAGALVGLAFVNFPWHLIIFGPVYANVAGFCLMPIAMALFMLGFAEGRKTAEALRIFVVLFVGIIGMVLCHPNTIFSCIVLLAPYCTSRIWELCNKKGLRTPHTQLACAGFVVFCLAFWVVCYKLPAMRSIVEHVWDPYTRPVQAIVNILTLDYTQGFVGETATQVVLAPAVIIGAIHLLRRPGKRWMPISYALACFILIVAGTRSDEFKQLVAGFWYTDSMRIATVCVIAAIPLATVGLIRVWELAVCLWRKLCAADGMNFHTRPLACVLAALFIVINFMPDFNLPGLHHVYTEEEQTQYKNTFSGDWPKSVNTTFGDFREYASGLYAFMAPLSTNEISFINISDTLVRDKDAVIINNPLDGSFFGYSLNGLRMYYRTFEHIGNSDETEESVIIRTRLCDYATDPEVQAAVKAIGAKYVIVLEDGIDWAGFINRRGEYDESLYEGITAINGSTKGFRCVYAAHGLAFYEIEEL